MRSSLNIALMVVAVLGAFFVYISGNTYRDFFLENQRTALAEKVQMRLSDMRRELDAESQKFAQLARSDAGLVAAVTAGKTAIATHRLDDLVDRSGLVSGRGKFSKIEILDADMAVLPDSTHGASDSVLDQPSCLSLRAAAVARKDVEYQKPVSGFCTADKNIFYLLIQPLGVPAPAAYLLLATDITSKLVGTDNIFGMPARLMFADGSLLNRSSNWPSAAEADHYLVTEQAFGIFASSHMTLNIAVSQDIQPFNERLARAQYSATLTAAAAILLAVLLLGFLLQKTAVKPLQTLINQLHKVRADNSHLGEHVAVAGNAETVKLGAGFNDMTTRLKELYGSLENLAFTDSLTKLPNRTLFHQRLEQAIEEAKHSYKPFALFLMDLDRFKDINDTLGHQIGDQLLQQVAARLRSKLREIDTVARMGGDEFAILLPAVSDKHATMAARMLLQGLRMPFMVGDQSLDIGASIGVALYPDHGVDANILIQRADVAMYAAKHANSGHALYDSALDQHNPTRLTLLGELRHAVEQEQFVLYYQPKVNLKNYQVMGVEALVRWNHPREDLMLPDTFVPLLEQTGMIRSLTPWVLNESLRQGQMLQNQGLPITISMNLSVRDLQDPYLADAFAEQLAALQISPHWLELEITESAVMTEPERALEVLTRLSGMGLRIAIDDFGTGYSSLSYLKKLPVNTIKIDKSFVIGMVRDDNDAAIVRTSIDLAHNLKLEVVAEGVENEETLKRLGELGCDTAQGHYISRPLSAAELEAWLQQSSWGLAKRNPKLVRLHK
ncbi:MAG: putative bifunctional diguanylate cyclase/phosphodiesterase [Sulfuricaulis sp.]